MNDNDQRWYIDAWAVLDGYAFASLRRPHSIEASITFFVAPPYFEPEPVASLATALAATRGHFQEGFHDGEGEEIPFDTLEQVVETIRRAYRAGGIDFNGTPLPTTPAPRKPEGPGVIHPASLVTPRMERDWKALVDSIREGSTESSVLELRRYLLAGLIENALAQLIPKFIGYTLVDMLTDLVEGASGHSERAREVWDWIDRSRALGIEVNIQPSQVVVSLKDAVDGFSWDLPELSRLPPSFVALTHPVLFRPSGSAIHELALSFLVPVPLIFQAETTQRYAAIPTLGHLASAATGDFRYILSVASMHEIVPLLVVALLQLPRALLPFPGYPPLPETPEIRELSLNAATWLSRALPSAALRGHPAEEAIHRLVIRLLRRPSAPTPINQPLPLIDDMDPSRSRNWDLGQGDYQFG